MKMLKKSDLVFTLLARYREEHDASLFWFRSWDGKDRQCDLDETLYREHSERYLALQDVLKEYGYTLHELLVIENCDASLLFDYVK